MKILELVDVLIGAGKKVKQTGDETYIAQCPAHDDGNPSLSLGQGRGQIVAYCFAGCQVEDIVSSVGLTMKDLFDDAQGIVYEYGQNKITRRVRRSPEKRFSQEVVVTGDGTLYHYPGLDLKASIAGGAIIFVAEGEKDVDSLFTFGSAVAVTNAGGAGSWKQADWSVLAGARELVVVADNDDAGMKRARELTHHLRTVVPASRAVRAKTGNDATEHLLAGHAVTDFIDIDIDTNPEFERAVTAVMNDREIRREALQRERLAEAAKVSAKLSPKLLGDILATEHVDDWVVPGLLAKGDRLVLTGVEGGGKSVWLRQISIMAAAGAHPFKSEIIDPLKVLVVDAENSERQWASTAKYVTGLATKRGVADPRERVIVSAGSRIDLRVQADVNQVQALIDEHKPNILQIGPLYKLVSGEITNDTDAAPLIEVLDSFREQGIVLLMEAHAGHAGKASKDLRPRGSSALLGWPEFGFGLLPDADNPEMVDLVRWRGDRELRDWPSGFRRGVNGELPWEPLRNV